MALLTNTTKVLKNFYVKGINDYFDGCSFFYLVFGGKLTRKHEQILNDRIIHLYEEIVSMQEKIDYLKGEEL